MSASGSPVAAGQTPIHDGGADVQSNADSSVAKPGQAVQYRCKLAVIAQRAVTCWQTTNADS